MKNIFKFILIFLFIQNSCKYESADEMILGKWLSYPRYNIGVGKYIMFNDNGVFETKSKRFLFTHKFLTLNYNPDSLEILNFNYKIDSVDEIGGIYYRLLNKDFSTLRRRYAIVDDPLIFDCGIKPIPLDNNYIYSPSVFIKQGENRNIELSQYFNQNFIFSDTLDEGNYYIYYNKLSGKSSIKKENSNLVITNEGITELNEFLDVRYLALKKYKAFIQKEVKLIEIPVIYYSSDINVLDYQGKKKFIDKICPFDNSKCLIIHRLNPGRSDFMREFGRELKGGNILNLQYISKNNLFKIFDRHYYGTNN